MFRRGDFVKTVKPEGAWRTAAIDAFFASGFRRNAEIPRAGRVYRVFRVWADPRRPEELFLALEGLTEDGGGVYWADWFRKAEPRETALPRVADLPVPRPPPGPLSRAALSALKRPTAYAPPCTRRQAQ
jgi:hypothetical protein